MPSTKKFSEFVSGGDMKLGQTTVGLESGVNKKFDVQLQFAETGDTANRPLSPATPTIRYNTDFEQFEYWDGAIWAQIGSSGDIAALIARLAAHTPGDGASMIGLQNQGAVLNKTVQDLAEADFVVKSNTTSLVNAFALSTLATGFLSVSTITGNLASRTFIPTTDQIDISNPTGSGGNPQFSISANPQLSGTSNLKIPLGTTGQRPGTPLNGMIRYNTTDNVFEFYNANAAAWRQVATTNAAVSSITTTANQLVASSPTGNVNLSIASNPIIPGTGGITLPTGTTAQRAGGAGTIRFNSQTSVFESTIDGAAWQTITTTGTGVSSVSGTAGRITSTGGSTPIIDIDASYLGQTSLTTLGTITTGVWNATLIAVAYGGTGVSSSTGTGSVVLNNTPTLITPNIGAATADSISHNGDSDNLIAFGTDTQTFSTNGSNRMSLSSSGMQLGAANATVTTILTDTTMAGAANTNLYTGLAIKTYVDNTAGASFPSGTIMLFAQTSAPTGWTKNTTTNNNSALRVVTGSAGTGGSVDFTTAFASQSVAGTNSGFTLTNSEIPAHTHTQAGTAGVANLQTGATPVSICTGTGSNTGSTGGGGSHTHTFTGTAINLAVKYVDVIQASKN